MNGSTGNMASGAPEKPGRPNRVMNLVTAQRMLPLVKRVAEDIVRRQNASDCLQPEQDRLDRNNRTLAGPERQRRYQVRDEIVSAERGLEDALMELQELGVVMLDGLRGQVGFPTVVNDRAAFFSWQRGEEGINHWHFAHETKRRAIPPAWNTVGDISLTGQS